MNKVVVYVLRSETGQLYVGLTKDLSRRLTEHARRQSPSTRRLQGKLELIYSRDFSTYAEARGHEKFLKSGAGRKLLRERQGLARPTG
jgi:predicted GIY-YIG superfamily endonuclease